MNFYIDPRDINLQGPAGMQLLKLLRKLIAAEEGGGGDEPVPSDVNDFFYCTYGTTTFAEIQAAITDGKVPVCIYGNEYYYLCSKTSAVYTFFNYTYTGNMAKFVWCRGSGWTNGSYLIQERLNFDYVPTAGSTNPVTSGGVYTAIQNAGGSDIEPYQQYPAMDGVASPGSSDDYARGDHVHPTDTSRAAVSDIPTKVSDLQNDSGFVNQNQAAAAAPVQSVNGQTGAVTVQLATDAQVETAVGAWLGENVAQETGYVLDASLTMSNAAAPADKVGDLNRTIGNVDYKAWADGYFGQDGAIYNATGTAEKYTVNYIPVLPGESLSLTITLTSGEAQWARWVFYDENKKVCGYGVQNQTWTASITIPIPVPKNAFYLRISFRTFNKITVFNLSRAANLITAIDTVNKSIPRKISGFRTIAHQGYSATEPTGRNLLEGYALAKEKGFDWGECDLQVSSDGILVCCHDGTFVDQSSGTTITISEHTVTELKTYNYYGGTIATFEEIVKTCKLNGLGLAIDQITMHNADKIFPIVKKYGMQEHVGYIIIDNENYPDIIGIIYNTIKSADPNAHIMAIGYLTNVNHTIDFLNTNKTDSNIMELYVNYSNFPYDTGLPTLQARLDSRINIGVWTIDYLTGCQDFLPFVSAICSNKISTYDLLA